jgi:hypothetical protein
MADEYVDISLPWQEIARNARTQLYLRNPAVIKLLCMKHGGCGQKERALQRSSKLELTAYRATPLGEVACNLPSVGPPHPEERERGSKPTPVSGETRIAFQSLLAGPFLPPII